MRVNCRRKEDIFLITLHHNSPPPPPPSSSHHDRLQLSSLVLMPETSAPHQHHHLLLLLILILQLHLLNSQHTHSDLFFQGFHSSSLILDGAAVIHSNGLLQLTNSTPRVMGHAFSPSPFRFKSPPSSSSSVSSFSTCFAFAVFPAYPNLGGHGFSFFLSPTTDLSSSLPSQYLGLFSSSNLGNLSNHILAIEFDTVRDFEFQDINDNHVGIDLDSLVSNASAPSPLNLSSSTLIFSWVDYDSNSSLLNVTISSSPAKPPLPVISFSVDLSPLLHDTMYAGFSASTGLLASSHYILGWSFSLGVETAPLDLSSLPSLPSPKKPRLALIAGLSSAAFLVGVFAVASAVYLIVRIRNAEVIEDWEFKIGPHRFAYEELKKATKGFREREIIGSGGFGRVYKGTLKKTQTEVAVKRVSHESKQGLREFLSEISSIGRLRHRNLVHLQGWCRRRGDLLLVYEFMKNGSLDTYLFGDKPGMVLSWGERFKIIKGVASGLLYLHEGWEQTVIHRDVKAGNVLLDSEMNARLGDFGLAKLYEHGTNPGTTRVVGTLGYLAPELTRTGKPTVASDVYAFGALVLEVVCGRRPIEQKLLPEEMVIVEWVWERWGEEGGQVADGRMGGEYVEEEVQVALKVGIMCSNSRPGMRPSMREVVRYLEGEARLPDKVPAPGIEERGFKGMGAAGAEMEDGSCTTTSSFFERVNLWSSGEMEAAAAAASAVTFLSHAGDTVVR